MTLVVDESFSRLFASFCGQQFATQQLSAQQVAKIAISESSRRDRNSTVSSTEWMEKSECQRLNGVAINRTIAFMLTNFDSAMAIGSHSP